MRNPYFEATLIWFEYLLNKRQNHKEDGANFCGLLRKAELYSSILVSTQENVTMEEGKILTQKRLALHRLDFLFII